MAMHNPPHPGDVLREYMAGRSVTEVAAHLGVSRVLLSSILNGRANVTADMAIRLSLAFGTSAQLWINLQGQRDLWVASRKKPKVKRLRPIDPAGDAAHAIA